NARVRHRCAGQRLLQNSFAEANSFANFLAAADSSSLPRKQATIRTLPAQGSNNNGRAGLTWARRADAEPSPQQTQGNLRRRFAVADCTTKPARALSIA